MQTINVGVTPAGIACTDNKIYVANNNNYAIPGQDSVSVFHNNKVTTIYDASFNQPYTITISHKHAYVTNSNSSTITIINIKKDTVVGVIDGFDGPSGIAIKCKIGYVNNYGGSILGSGNGHTVSIVDLITKTIIGTIEVALAPSALKLSENGKYLYVISYVDGNPGTGILTIIKTKNNIVINSISGFSGPFDIAIHDKQAFITNFGSNNFSPFGTTLSIVNLKNLTIKNIYTGIQPSGVCVSPCGCYAYVTNYNTLYAGPSFTNLTPGQGTVSVIDIKSQKVLYNIQVNQSPANICFQDGNLYVTNFISNTMNIINLK